MAENSEYKNERPFYNCEPNICVSIHTKPETRFGSLK